MSEWQSAGLTYSLVCTWDQAAGCWCGHSDGIHGLVLEAPTLAELFREAAAVAPELMRLNGQPCPSAEKSAAHA